jgi:hypothetical protein
MNDDRIAEVLAGPHQAVLSVARAEKGPLAVPMSYRFVDGVFMFVTGEETLHGRLMRRRGRATMTVQDARSDGLTVHQWYVIAEGPVSFAEEDPLPVVRAIMAKDRGAAHADAWTAHSPPVGARVALLVPDRLSGYEFHDALSG